MITDAQVHLWEANRPDRPWPAGTSADLVEPMTAERFLPLMDEVGVDRAVIAPPYVAGFTPTYALECAARYPRRFAVMGRYDPDNPRSLELLPDWLASPGMLAIRINLGDPHGPRWQAAGTLDPFWAGVERYQIPVAISSLRDVSTLEPALTRHPGLRIIIDHLGLYRTGLDEWEHRLAALLALARFSGVAVKVSALPLVSHERFPFRDLHEPIRRIHLEFGPRRMLWGADQTTVMSKGLATYQENLEAIRLVASEFFPAVDLPWILGRSLAAWLNWPEDEELPND